jgi:hypothetical protein
MSRSHGPHAQEWTTCWEAYLTGKIGVGGVVELVLPDYRRIAIQNIATRAASGDDGTALSDVEKRVDLCDNVRSDLLELTQCGANPAVLARLLRATDSNQGEDLEDQERRVGFEEIKQHAYWKKRVAQLKRARDGLREFIDTEVYRDIEKGLMRNKLELKVSPFVRICKSVRTTERSLDKLIKGIRELRLDEGARDLIYSDCNVIWRATEGTRGPKPGKRPRRGWELPAFGLWKYLTVRTGQPHWRRIARLLHFAGWEFPGVVESKEDPSLDTERVEQDEVDKLSKRVKKLLSEPGLKLEMGDAIMILESRYETRDPLDYEGFLSTEASRIAEGRIE